MPPTIDYQYTPFPMIHYVPVGLICYHDTLGAILGYFTDRYVVYLKDIIPRTSCSKIKVWEKKFRGAYIVKIEISPVVTLNGYE